MNTNVENTQYIYLLYLLLKRFTRVPLIGFLQFSPVKKLFFEQDGFIMFCESAKDSPVRPSLSFSVLGKRGEWRGENTELTRYK